MTHVTVAIAATKTLTVVLGGVITYFAYTAYRRTEARELRALAVGFGVVTLGSVLGGATDLGSDVVQLSDTRAVLVGVLVQSLLTLVGFAVITYSLYRE